MKRLDRAPPRSNKAKRKRLAALRRKDALGEGEASLLSQLEAERRQAEEREQAALDKLAASRRHTRNPQATLDLLRQGLKVEVPVHSPLNTVALHYVAARREGGASRVEALHRLMLQGLRQRLLRAEHGTALLAASRLSAVWLRPPEVWKPRSKNPRKQLSSLLRHLFARYDVPLLFDQAFTDDDPLHQQWFLHLGRGQNLRTAPELPTTLTKKMAHHVLRAPTSSSIEGALRWGQVVALGGSPRMAAAVLGTSIGGRRSFDDDAFWVTVLRFFARAPLLDAVHYGPIADYLAQARRDRPTLSMKGRTPASLLDRVTAWHRQLGWERHGDHTWDRPARLQDLEWRPPDPRDPERLGPVTWTVAPLLASGALRDEGRALEHCVATYGGSCRSGRTSIWSLRQATGERLKREATIEVNHAGHRPQVVQVRGKRNSIPARGVWLVLERWLRLNGLQVAPWVPRS